MITLTQQNYTFNLQPIANQLFQIKNSRGPRLGAPKTKLPVQTIQFAGFANIGQNEFRRLLNEIKFMPFPKSHKKYLFICGDKVESIYLKLSQNPCLFLQRRGFRTQRLTEREKENVVEGSPTIGWKGIVDFLKGPKNKLAEEQALSKFNQIKKDTNKLADPQKVVFMDGFTKGLLISQQQKTIRNGFAKARRIAFWIGGIIVLYLVVSHFIPTSNGKIFALIPDLKDFAPEITNVTFDDVRGMDEAKLEVEEIVNYLRDPERYSRLGGRLPKGVLLIGPPGTGKTLLARAIAGEAEVPFYHASGSEFDEILVGQGAKRVRDLFARAKTTTPCIIFIDEIDSVGSKRTSSSLHPYANQTINQLLSEMDGFVQNEGIIIIGATNRKEDLDKALLRPGRFDIQVHVQPPDLIGRKDIFKLYLSKVIHENINVTTLAKGTTGFTGADIENMVNQAALKAATEGAMRVTMRHLDEAKDRIIMGPARLRGRLPDEEVNKNTAYHEAGHALVAYFTPDAQPLHKVTIIQRGQSLGHTSFLPDKDIYDTKKSQLLAQIDVTMGGRVAEELIFGADKITTGAMNDLQNATQIATELVKTFGMSEKAGLRNFSDSVVTNGILAVDQLSPQAKELIDKEIDRILLDSYARAKEILTKRKREHQSLAEALLEYETLSAKEIDAIIKGDKISREERPVALPNLPLRRKREMGGAPVVRIQIKD